MSHVNAALQDYKIKRDELLAMFPALSEDLEALHDTLEGETTLHEKLAAMMRKGVEHEVMAEALAAMIRDMQVRKSRLENSAETTREAVAHIMSEAGVKKITAPDLTISISDGRPKVIITDPDEIPQDYLKYAKPTPDKTLIGQALKDGYPVPGATLSNAMPILTVRRS